MPSSASWQSAAPSDADEEEGILIPHKTQWDKQTYSGPAQGEFINSLIKERTFMIALMKERTFWAVLTLYCVNNDLHTTSGAQTTH